MPTIVREGPYRVFFYSADCAEPAHVHIQRGTTVAKVWLHDAAVARTGRFSAGELRAVIALVRRRAVELMDGWNEHCGR